MRTGKSDRPNPQTSAFMDIAELRLLRRSEQVAAVCFRVRKGEIEFLLVQTGGGRWTFPKGNAEPGLTHAQSAALEAFEEAGVHGRIEEACFAKYVRRKGARILENGGIEVVTNAHLCEVLWLDEPQEIDRDPTWFNVPKSKRRLCAHRTPEDGAEHTRIVDLAVQKISNLEIRDSRFRNPRRRVAGARKKKR